jgi:hypothetical protein
MTRDAVDQLMLIFKQQAKKAKDNATTQRVLKEHAQAERVHNESTPIPTDPSQPPPFEVNYPDVDVANLQGTCVILQDEDDYKHSSPTSNTCQQWKVCTIMQDYLLHMMDISGLTKPFSNQQAAAHKYPLQLLCDFASAVLDDKTGNLLEYHHLLKHPKYKDVWSRSFGTEIQRLPTTTKTIAFMSKDIIPQNRRKDITYRQIVCNYCSEKKDPNHTRINMGRNLINYLDDCGRPTSDLLTVKIMFNSGISMPNAKFMAINIKEFYIMTPMDQYKYFNMKLELFLPDIIDKYGLHDKVDADGNVFCKVQRGMYGLPQAGTIAQDLLTKQLNNAGYQKSKITPGYW